MEFVLGYILIGVFVLLFEILSETEVGNSLKDTTIFGHVIIFMIVIFMWPLSFILIFKKLKRKNDTN